MPSARIAIIAIFRVLPVIASFARALLFVELLLWVSLAASLRAAGWSTFAALAAVLALAALLRVGITINTFAAASALAVKGDAGRPPFAGRLLIILEESWWTAVTFSALLPFPRLGGSMDSAVPCSAANPPVLLVHGYLCNHGIWRNMKRYLESRGISTWTHDAEPAFSGIDEYVAALTARIEAILDRTGAPKIVLIGHSMGGLILRAYIRAHGGGRVALVITLGSPHHGTRIAHRGMGKNARQMTPSSDWLKALARAESGCQPSPFVSIWSRHDNVVAPQESAQLEGAENIAIEGVGHVALAFSGAVRSLILGKILGTAPRGES